MIAYIEVRDKYSRLPFAVIEPAECWFELQYYGVGEFEIYASASKTALAAFQIGNYVTLPHLPYIWIIEGLKTSFEAGRGYMLSVTGRQAKAILEKRIINKQTQLPNGLTSAVFLLILKNAGEEAGDARKIEGLNELTSVVVKNITETQVSYENLLTYTDELLQAYEVGAELTITEAAAFRYTLFEGVDRSEEIIFSQTFDNLLATAYGRSGAGLYSFALIGGQGEGAERVLQEYNARPTARGIDRAETFVDAKDISSKYTDENGEEKELDLSSAEGLKTYKAWLTERGKPETDSREHIETFEGEIDVAASSYKFGRDFYLGDRVRVQDDRLNIYITPRILKFTMRQDRNYGEIVEYGG